VSGGRSGRYEVSLLAVEVEENIDNPYEPRVEAVLYVGEWVAGRWDITDELAKPYRSDQEHEAARVVADKLAALFKLLERSDTP
jgi:hypothetical protein